MMPERELPKRRRHRRRTRTDASPTPVLLGFLLCFSFAAGCADDPEPRSNPSVAAEADSGEAAFANLFEGASRELDGDDEGALNSYEKAYRQSPDSETLCRSLAEIYRKIGRTADALTLLEQHAEKSADGAPTCRLTRIDILDRENRRDDAEAEVKALLSHNPDRFPVFRALFERYIELQNPRAAAEVILKGAPKARDPASIYAQAGRLLEDHGLYGPAEKAFTAGLETAPRRPALTLGLARTLEARRSFDRALARYEAHLVLYPKDGVATLGAVDLLVRMSRIDRALTLLTDLPQDAWKLWARRGGLLQRRGDLAGALAAWDHVAATVPNRAQGHLSRAFILEELGRIDEAETAGLRALDADKRSVAVRHFLAFLWAVSNRPDRRADAFAAAAIAAEPQSGIFLATAGLLKSRAGDRDEATALFEKALAGDEDPYVHWLYSLHLSLGGLDDEAQQELRKAARGDRRFEKLMKKE